MTLFGMNVMSSGLERLSGGVLEKTLEKATSSRFKGVVLGAAVTALIQSSSATTVMAVGFVNSGIMQLKQAVSQDSAANYVKEGSFDLTVCYDSYLYQTTNRRKIESNQKK